MPQKAMSMNGPTRNGRVLLVEDEAPTRKLYKRVLERGPGLKSVSREQVIPMTVTLAANVREAQMHLADAAATMSPFDVMLLDMKLPHVPNGENDEEAGLKILETTDERTCQAVCIFRGQQTVRKQSIP